MNRGVLRGVGPGVFVTPVLGGGDPANDGLTPLLDSTSQGGVKLGGTVSRLQTIASSGAALTLDPSQYGAFKLTLTANCTLAFANPSSGSVGNFDLFVYQDGTGSRTLAFPASVTWASGSAPTVSSGPGSLTILAFASPDGGATWIGRVPFGSTAVTVVQPANTTTDYGPAINAAIIAANAAGGGIVQVNPPPGVLAAVKVNTTVQPLSSVYLRGAGHGTAFAGTANPMIALPSSGAAVDRILISDLHLQQPVGHGIVLDTTGETGFWQLGWPRISFINVTVDDAGGDAFRVNTSGVIECRFINCVSLRHASNGFNINGTDNFLIGCTAAGSTAGVGFSVGGANNHLSTCKAYGNGGIGFSVAGGGRHELGTCEAQDNAGAGFSMATDNNAIAGCLADSNGGAGFLLGGNKNTLSGCHAVNRGGAYTTPVGFLFDAAVSQNIVQGRTSGIAIPVGGELSGNTAHVNAAPGSQIDIAYAAALTVDPYAGETQRTTLTGAVTLTPATIAHKGQRVSLALTQDATGGRAVTFASTFQSTGAVPTTANSCTVITFEWDGRYWMEVGRSTVTGVSRSTGVADTFTKADNAGSLGTTTSGALAWTNLIDVFGILSNQAYAPAGGFNTRLAYVDCGKSDVTVSVTVNVVTNAYLAFRVTDANNYWDLQPDGIHRKSAGVDKVVSAAALPASNGDVIGVILSGPNIVATKNGVPILGCTVSDTFNQNATKHGLIAAANTERFTNFKID